MTDAEWTKFLDYVQIELGCYQAVTRFMNSRKPKEIGRRLRWVRDNSLDMLANEKYGIANLDQLTKSLLADACFEISGAKLNTFQDGILAVCNAASLALVWQKKLPNRSLDHPIRDLTHRVAIYLRDIAHIEPKTTANGTFAKLVKAITKIAGRKKV